MTKLDPTYVARLLKSVGLTYDQLVRKGPIKYADGTVLDREVNDRVKVVIMNDEHPAALIPDLGHHNLKTEWLLLVRNPEDVEYMEDDFWHKVIDQLDRVEPFPNSMVGRGANLKGDESPDELIAALAAIGWNSYDCTRESLLWSRSLAYALSKMDQSIPSDQTFSEFVKNDDWLGRVQDDEYQPDAINEYLARNRPVEVQESNRSR